MKRKVALLSALLLSCGLFSGCVETGAIPPVPESVLSAEPAAPVTLRIVTEEGADGYVPAGKSELIAAIHSAAAYYESVHEKIEIEIETLPNTENERETALEELREEIKTGNGPDIYLLPAGDLPAPENYLEKAQLYKDMNMTDKIDAARMPSLFLDMELAMRGGAFADISAFYDKDEALKKDELNEKIMDAGVYDGKRYILPLGYSIPVVYADKIQADELGMDLNEIENGGKGGINTLQIEVNSTGRTVPTWGLASLDAVDDLSLFPSLYNYDSMQIELDKTVVSQSLFLYKGNHLSTDSYQPESSCDTVEQYLESEKFFLQSGWAFRIAGLGGAAERVGLGKYLGVDLSVFPLRTPENTLIATVTYWGAVDSSCDAPEVAYDFLRLFLSPNIQFGLGLGEEYPVKLAEAAQTGWPVRTQGSVQAMWKQAVSVDDPANEKLLSKMAKINLSDSDLPILQEELHQVRFPNGLATLFDNAQREALDYGIQHTTDEMDRLAEELLTQMGEYMTEAQW